MNTSVKIVLKLDYTKKDGTQNVRLRLTINRKVKYFPLQVYIFPKHFINGKVSLSDPGHFNKNLLLDKFLNKANKIIFDARINESSLTFDSFERNFSNNIYGSKSFYDFVDLQIEKLEGKLTPGSLKGYHDQKNKLKQFRPTLQFKDIDRSFIEQYETFLIKKRKNNSNTITKSMKFIKSILNKAKVEEIIKDNVFDNIPIGRTEGNREFLTRDELNKLEILYYNNKLKANWANVLRYFLFSCYTGLRYSDIKGLKFNDIKDDNKYISVKMIKTKKPVIIPLIDKAKLLLQQPSFKMQRAFNVLSDQPTNRYLKEIMKVAGINKSISFHCARHTFATLSKSLGMDYDVISKILGHTDIKTTKIYAKYEYDFLDKEMGKWG